MLDHFGEADYSIGKVNKLKYSKYRGNGLMNKIRVSLSNIMSISKFKRTIVSIRDSYRSKRIKRATIKGNVKYLACKFNLADISHLQKVDRTSWEKTANLLVQYNLRVLKHNDKIKVAFILYSAAMWSCDILYKMLNENVRFDPYIIVSRYMLDSNMKTFPTFQKSIDSLKNSGYRVVSIDKNTPKNKCYEAMGSPDIIFYLTPYSVLYPEGQNEAYMPAKTLCVYIPYSYMLISDEGKFDSPGMTLSWRHFSDSQLYRQMLLRYSDDYTRNTFFVGYPKMDVYYNPAEKNKKDLWKLPYGEQMKCIIYAPHHSLPGSQKCSARFSTFDKNYRDILNYAKTRQDTTSWIIKPHPNLKMTVLETGFFNSETDYLDYLAEWEALPNARVVEESTYYDIFKTSDAMICDSVSFLAEYQFTGKPLLLLTRQDNNFNEFGAQVAEHLYKVPGTDLKGIEHFIESVVVNGNDYMNEDRKKFFNENLDYRAGGKPSASRQIYEHIMNEIEGA